MFLVANCADAEEVVRQQINARSVIMVFIAKILSINQTPFKVWGLIVLGKNEWKLKPDREAKKCKRISFQVRLHKYFLIT